MRLVIDGHGTGACDGPSTGARRGTSCAQMRPLEPSKQRSGGRAHVRTAKAACTSHACWRARESSGGTHARTRTRPWGSCESDPIGRTAENGFRLQLVGVLRVRRAHVPSWKRGFVTGARATAAAPSDACLVLSDRRCKPSQRCTGSAAAATQPGAVCMHAARAKACVHPAIASPSECE